MKIYSSRWYVNLLFEQTKWLSNLYNGYKTYDYKIADIDKEDDFRVMDDAITQRQKCSRLCSQVGF